MTRTYLDNEYATLWYHTDTKIIHYKIKQDISGEKLKELYCTGTEVLKKYKAEKWISDDRNNSALTQQDREWANDQWFPNTARQGWKYWAIIEPEKTAQEMHSDSQSNLVLRGGVIVGAFSNPDEAMDWLVKQ